ncbi:MAG: TIGR01212 family radical SAM protein [Treponema sp.]|nr:TIGR01212 family radical SAM protein [Candidatus Treponema merdequi]
MKYLSVNEYYRKIFGRKIYKITLDAGCTCPNRDGTRGTGGCIFCSASGSGDFTASRNLSITQQIEEAKKLVQKKINKPETKNQTTNPGNINSTFIIRETQYIAYFQNFTNTYGDESQLISKYKEALSHPEIAGIAIATRPDCLSDSILEKINLLTKKQYPQLENGKTISKEKYFSIEFGLQTSNEKTAEYINRCYKNEEYFDAVNRVKKINKDIHIVTHVIFGLPEETEEDMLNSVQTAIDAGTDGIKIQVLNVLKGTRLEKEFYEKQFHILTMEEYFSLIVKALKIIPPEIVIHRLTGDGPKNLLIEPKWIADKKRVLNELTRVINICSI